MDIGGQKPATLANGEGLALMTGDLDGDGAGETVRTAAACMLYVLVLEINKIIKW